MQSLPADSTGGHGCRQPFVFNTPALPLSLQPHLTSFVYLCLSSFSGFTFSLLTTSHPPIETFFSSSLTYSEGKTNINTFYYLFTFHFIWRTLVIDTTLSVSSCPQQPLNALVVCLLFFWLLSSNCYFMFSFPGCFASSFFSRLPFACSLHTKCFQMEGNKLKHHNKMQQERPSAHAQGK